MRGRQGELRDAGAERAPPLSGPRADRRAVVGGRLGEGRGGEGLRVCWTPDRRRGCPGGRPRPLTAARESTTLRAQVYTIIVLPRQNGNELGRRSRGCNAVRVNLAELFLRNHQRASQPTTPARLGEHAT